MLTFSQEDLGSSTENDFMLRCPGPCEILLSITAFRIKKDVA